MEVLNSLSNDEINEIACYFMTKGNHRVSALFSEATIERDPARFDALANLGGCYLALDRLDDSRAALDAALKINAVHPGGWFNLAMLYRKLGRFEDERACLEVAMEQNAPNLKDVLWGAMAHNSQYFGEDARAIEEYRKSLEANPNNDDIRMSIGILQMKLGNWAEGLANYEYRLKPHPIKWASDSILRWDAASGFYPNRRILVCAEQGTGDTFQYARYGAILKQTFKADHVALYCADNLVPIMSKWPGWDEIIPHSSEGSIDFDIQIAMMSIPLALQQRGVDFFVPPIVPLLDYRPLKKYSRCKAVGLCWRGNPDHPNDKFRSIPLMAISDLLRHCGQWAYLYGFHFQIDPTEEESSLIPAITRGDKAWITTAEQMYKMDLMVTCDTATAHLAGTLGVPTWILLPLNSDFRWGVDSDTTPWYKSVRLFRQKKLGEWGPVIEEVMEELKKL